ncbi:MAG: hypothetical protein ACKO8F_10180, partial [Acidimicrobiaceae bacterium]
MSKRILLFAFAKNSSIRNARVIIHKRASIWLKLARLSNALGAPMSDGEATIAKTKIRNFGLLTRRSTMT